MYKYELKPLSDEEILERSNGLVTNASKFHVENRKYTGIPGGIYDVKIFGQKHRCICGVLTSPGYCHSCEAYVIDKTNEYDYYGHYVLAYPVVYEIKKLRFLDQFYELMRSIKFGYNFSKKMNITENMSKLHFSVVPSDDGYLTDNTGKLFNLVVKFVDDIEDLDESDFERIGTLGLFNICKNFKGLNLVTLKGLINELIIISPIVTRPASVGHDGKLMIHRLSSSYAELIHISENIKNLIKSLDSLEDKIALSIIIENAVNALQRNYALIGPSKESTIRYITKRRLPKSGRANAVSVSNIKIDEVMIPEALAYEALKTDIIEKLEATEAEKSDVKNDHYIKKLAYFKYDNVTPEALEVLHAIAEGDPKYDESGSVVIINRAPTLHELSMMAFKVKLWEEPAIGVHINVVEPFNLDFDGDQVGCYFVTKDPLKTRILNDMSPKNNWFYKKNQKPIFVPKSSMLLGLFHASRFVQGSEVRQYYSYSQVVEDRINGVIKYNETINLEGKITTYGRERLSKIIEMPISNLIGDEAINAKNIAKIISIIGSKANRIDIVSDLINFSREIVTQLGNSVISLKEVYDWMPRYTEVEEIMNSKMDNHEKYIKIEKLIPKIIDEQIKKLSGTSYGYALQSGAVVKKQSLYEMLQPRVTYDKRTNDIDVTYDSLVTGLTESELVQHAMANRVILDQKAKLVPVSGYFTKQLVDFLSDIVYKVDKLSEDTQGILMYKCMAEGRTLITGEVVKPNDSYDLVRVKSCVYSDKPIVCKDEINTNFFHFPNNYRIGYSLTTSTTEDITQKQLGLKHGGSVYFPDPEVLTWKKDVTFESKDDRKLVLRDSDNVILEFPISNGCLMSNDLINGFVKAGDPILYSSKVNYVDNKLASFKALVGLLSKKLETNIEPVDCYAFNDGKIHYEFDANKVYIGSKKYNLSHEVYYYPEGYEVKLGMKICSGVLDTRKLMDSNIDIGTKYFVFSKAVVELLIDDFRAGKLPIALESLELIMKQFYHTNSASVSQANMHNQAMMSRMKGGYCKQTIQKNVGKEIKDDLLMRLLFNNNNLSDYGE